MSPRLPGWCRGIIEGRESDVDVPASCEQLVRPLTYHEIGDYEYATRGAATVLGPGFGWHRELGNGLTASISGEVRDAV